MKENTRIINENYNYSLKTDGAETATASSYIAIDGTASLSFSLSNAAAFFSTDEGRQSMHELLEITLDKAAEKATAAAETESTEV